MITKLQREKEVAHGVSLLHEIQETWEGGYTLIPIDAVCRFNDGDGFCDKTLWTAVVLLGRGDPECHVLALCEHHAEIMEEAVGRWRTSS